MTNRQTLRGPVVCAGVGLHTGQRVRMVMKPAAAGTGIVFARVDLDVNDRVIPALFDSVRSTDLGTTLLNDDGASVATVEHLMAALAGMGVDDVLIELDGPEVPAMDGSSAPFIELIDQAGLVTLPMVRRAIQVLKTVEVEQGGRKAAWIPALRAAIDVEIDFADASIGHQHFAFEVNPAVFSQMIAPARTFGFRRDYDALLKAGLARGASLDNTVVVGERGVDNAGGLRFDDEFVRHKALDALGDIYLAGMPILGLYRAYRPGHGFNNHAVHTLLADKSAWRVVALNDAEALKLAMAR
ncbi:UDP-3-O-acyl-N-acetylglucosamine deacetylase [Woodsholea maritima]|uniref:UDP-3-O-acyl-N-acetylglucosamine deacetylase n=1 Tax=Woodsholea maritima TaxID=240237 RepID=UPI00037D79BB|nr:UDP-3-O-acyl-N-acetylglucosamine deacetylase [Woodsholea maritima]